MRTENRSERLSLVEGATDGKYRKARPDTEVMDRLGNELMMANRAALTPLIYDFITREASVQVSPAGFKRVTY